MKTVLQINDQEVVIDGDPGLRLIHVLRNELFLCSAKTGCMEGHCGSCMVLLNDKPVPSCIIPAAAARGCSIVTLEGFRENPVYEDISAAFKQLNASLCGFCNASRYFAAYAVISKANRPSREFIYSQIGSIECNCIDMEQFANVILLAAANKRKRESNG